jgi:hypothetical protein
MKYIIMLDESAGEYFHELEDGSFRSALTPALATIFNTRQDAITKVLDYNLRFAYPYVAIQFAQEVK